MNENCPVCGLDFDRGDPGHFTGAMYASYAMAIPLLAVLTVLEYLIFPSWSLFRLVMLAAAISTPFDSVDLAVFTGALDLFRSVLRPGRRQGESSRSGGRLWQS